MNIDELMKNAGISQFVYNITYPETKLIKEEMWLSLPHDMYSKTPTKKQDNMHFEFFEAWLNWTKPVLNINDYDFKYFYPTYGSSDAIKETIAYHATNRSVDNFIPTIHIFNGEYQGYELYAKNYNVRIIKHDINNYKQSIMDIAEPNDQFYLSQPSSKDGNIWKGYDEFLNWMVINCPKVKIMLDLCYIGTVANEYFINANYNNINTIFFSLSKSFGTFYDRIGGVFCKDEIPNLNENIWLKNLMSLKLGTKLLKTYSVYHLPQKYQYAQKEAIKIIGRNIIVSDVILLGHKKTNKPDELDKYLTRGDNIRYCLTPIMDQIIYP